ncbi:hypothetical protein DENSPDRAFT_632201 [Dentipellis sp. KUC8613]|nr:hypothetical protein DENSPDRAFT_632201 [Dentipellis sp. KUC8613]
MHQESVMYPDMDYRAMDTHPINDLPAEIIVQILLMYVQGVSFRHNNSRGRWVVKISSICRFWRSIVLDTKSFWCTIFGPGMRFAQLCLERSGDAPLVVEFRTEGAEYVQMIRSVLPRVREVHFRGLKNLTSVSKILQSLDRPAPHLRVLNIPLDYGNFGFENRTPPTVFASAGMSSAWTGSSAAAEINSAI